MSLIWFSGSVRAAFCKVASPMLAKPLFWRGIGLRRFGSFARALEIGHQTGITFSGPSILGPLALALSDPSERRQMLGAKRGNHSQPGCVAHNQLRFYPDAIDVALELGEWDEAQRYAAALEDFTRAEPLPWSDFFAARGRALVALGRGCVDDSTKPELERLEAEGRRLDYRIALPPIEQALARL